MSAKSAFTTAINIFASPGEAFVEIKQRATFLLPLLLICTAAAAANWLYVIEVDLGWLTEQQLRAQSFIDLTDAQITDMANRAAARGPALAITQSVIGSYAVITIILLLEALYLKIVSAVRKDGVTVKQWMSLASWTSLPAILASLATAIFILTNDVRFVSQTGINPLSFSNLLGLELPESGTIVRIAANLSFINLWSLGLMIFGYRAVSGAGLATAFSVVLVPVAVIFALIYMFI